MLNVDHWPNQTFVTYNGKRPDTFFCQYTAGKMKPNYPMPAIRYDVDWFPYVVVFRLYTEDDYELPEVVARLPTTMFSYKP